MVEYFDYVTGPFSSCHSSVDPEPYYFTCTFDVCAFPDDSDRVLCDQLTDYTQACKNKYVDIQTWRNETFCRKCI